MMTDEGRELFSGIAEKLAPSEDNGAFAMNEALIQMLGGFTFLRLAGLIGTMGVNLTKEELLDINKRLNGIKKP